MTAGFIVCSMLCHPGFFGGDSTDCCTFTVYPKTTHRKLVVEVSERRAIKSDHFVTVDQIGVMEYFKMGLISYLQQPKGQ